MAGPRGPEERPLPGPPGDGLVRNAPPPNVVVVHRRPVDEPDAASADPTRAGKAPHPMDADGPTRSVRRAIDLLVGEIEAGLAERRDEERS